MANVNVQTLGNALLRCCKIDRGTTYKPVFDYERYNIYVSNTYIIVRISFPDDLKRPQRFAQLEKYMNGCVTDDYVKFNPTAKKLDDFVKVKAEYWESQQSGYVTQRLNPRYINLVTRVFSICHKDMQWYWQADELVANKKHMRPVVIQTPYNERDLPYTYIVDACIMPMRNK